MNSDTSIDFQYVKKVIREAFKDVTKGESVSLREAAAMDNNASPEDRSKARALDTEEHWWDLSGDFDTGFIYTGSKEGIRFILPAAMSAGDTHAVHMFLCFPYNASAPHHGHKEYINYLRSVDPKKIASYFEFTENQLHAIGLFLKWWMQSDKKYLYEDRQETIKLAQERHDQSKDLPKTHYDLSVDDELAFFDEECRVLKEWLTLGKV